MSPSGDQRPLLCSGPAVLLCKRRGFFVGQRTPQNMDSWKVTAGTACFHSASWRAEIRLDRPEVGLHGISTLTGGQWHPSFARQLLGLEVSEFDCPISDAVLVDQHVRGRDLVATYERHEPRHIRPQVDWRLVDHVVDMPDGQSIQCAGVRLLVSLTTNCLDGRPTLSIRSQFEADEFLSMAPRRHCSRQPDGVSVTDQRACHTLSLIRCEGTGQTWLQMVLPCDLIQLELKSTEHGGCESTYRLLNEPLEKGVIRRVQIAAWCVPRVHDRWLATELLRQFETSPPPISV